MKLEPLGDAAVVATLGEGIDPGTLARVLGLAQAVAAERRAGVTDLVAAYNSVTVFYDPLRFGDEPYGGACRLIEDCALRATHVAARAPAALEIPVAYGGEHGPDLEALATRLCLPADAVVGLHAGADYLVYAVGFSPGFPYLGGLPEALHAPRLRTPRTRVPAGSVGIGGSQTGVYTVASPGGWNLIGRTPLALFDPKSDPAARLRPGDRVRFVPRDAAELFPWK